MTLLPALSPRRMLIHRIRGKVTCSLEDTGGQEWALSRVERIALMKFPETERRLPLFLAFFGKVLATSLRGASIKSCFRIATGFGRSMSNGIGLFFVTSLSGWIVPFSSWQSSIIGSGTCWVKISCSGMEKYSINNAKKRKVVFYTCLNVRVQTRHQFVSSQRSLKWGVTTQLSW